MATITAQVRPFLAGAAVRSQFLQATPRPGRRGVIVQILGAAQTLDRLPDHLLRAVAQHAFGTDVETLDESLQVGGDDQHMGRGPEQGIELAQGAVQLQLGVLAAIDIRMHADHAQRLVLSIAQHHLPATEDPLPTAVLAVQTVLVGDRLRGAGHVALQSRSAWCRSSGWISSSHSW